jgi:hypothetical protein
MPKRKDARQSRNDPHQGARLRNLGLPDKETIVSERTFTSPKGKRYRIIRTTEKDPYDPPDDEDKSRS